MSDIDRDMLKRMDVYMSAFVSADIDRCISREGAVWLNEHAMLAYDCMKQVDKHLQVSKELKSEDYIEKMYQRKRGLKGLPE